MEAAKRDIDRQAAMAPYLASFEDGLPPLHPSIALDQWERSALDEALSSNGNGKQYAGLLIEGVAFQTKYYSELEQLETEECTSAEAPEKSRETLIVNAAIGLALMDEMQRVVDSLVLSGNMGEAKKLTGFRNKLSQIVHEIKDRVGTESFNEAHELSRGMVAPLEESRPKIKTAEAKLVEPDEKPPMQIKLNRYKNLRMGRPVEERLCHSKKLLVVFAVAVAAWLILVLPGLLRTPLPELTAAELPPFEAIREIDARPPSLYIVVDSKKWNGLSSDRRLQWVEKVAEVTSAAGYTGIHVRTDKGAPVALWLKEQGARLVEASAIAS